jgi:two-component system, sensor histidine kinase YesM
MMKSGIFPVAAFGGRGKPVTIRKRLLFSFGIVIAILSVLSAIIFSTIQQTHRFLGVVQEDLFEVEALSASVEDLHETINNYLHSGRIDYLKHYDEVLRSCMKRTQDLRGRLPGDLRYNMMDIANMVKSFDELKTEAVTRYAEGIATIYVDRYLAELMRLRGYIRSECSAVLSTYMRGVNDQVTLMKEGLEFRERLSYLALLFVTGVCIFIALRMTRDISVPIHELVRSLESFAEGSLDLPPLERRTNDEISVLVHSFNSMTERIRGLVGEIRRNSELESELKRREIRSLEMENALKQSELETLQSRINPHFLFNTLTTIASLAEIEDAPRTKGAVGSLAILLRQQLVSARAVIRLDEELESVEHYLRLQEIRFGARLRFSIDRDPGTEGFLLPGMILQPFVENAVIHGLEPLEEGGAVRIEACAEGKGLRIVVSDDGIGFDVAEIRESGDAGRKRSHEGILNVSRRMELLYGCPSVFVESGRGSGTVVTIRIPSPLPPVSS